MTPEEARLALSLALAKAGESGSEMAEATRGPRQARKRAARAASRSRKAADSWSDVPEDTRALVLERLEHEARYLDRRATEAGAERCNRVEEYQQTAAAFRLAIKRLAFTG